MAWAIASAPFWILGAFFLFAAPMAIIKREPEETGSEIGGQFITALLCSSAAFSVAAWISS